jgi:hypothetical protein
MIVPIPRLLMGVFQGFAKILRLPESLLITIFNDGSLLFLREEVIIRNYWGYLTDGFLKRS